MKYRKKPVVIEAEQWFGFDSLHEEDGIVSQAGLLKNPGFTSAHIKTLEGIMTVEKFDYIIKGVDGEFYPCNPDIFKKTYEVIE